MCVWRISPFTAETMRATELVANLLRNDSPGSADFASAAWRALRELVRSPEPRGKSTDRPVRRQPNFVRSESPRGHTVPRRFQCCWNSPTPARNLAANRGAGCGKFRRERDRAWKIPQRADLGRQVVGHMANLPRFRGIVLQGSPTAGMRRGEMPPLHARSTTLLSHSGAGRRTRLLWHERCCLATNGTRITAVSSLGDRLGPRSVRSPGGRGRSPAVGLPGVLFRHGGGRDAPGPTILPAAEVYDVAIAHSRL
jgi:hypothetical protein